VGTSAGTCLQACVRSCEPVSHLQTCRPANLQTYMDATIKDFEAAIAELEGIVKKLEEGDLPLEKSLELYERGVQLSRFCHARLEDAEKRIEVLNERGELKAASPSLGLPGDDDR
jgi:exodeoxyribonuclease VII small subunit